jgi:hypothetical protein
MKSKVVATVLAAALAVSSISVPAYADDNQKKHQAVYGVFGALAGPIGIAAAIGGSSFTQLKWVIWKKVFINLYYPKPGLYKLAKLYHHGFKIKDIDLVRYGDKKYVKVKLAKKKYAVDKHKSAQGKFIVACIMGSALGAISASARKATALGNPPAWRSQAEHASGAREDRCFRS